MFKVTINLSYVIDPTLTKVNRLFLLSFEKIEEDNVKNNHRDSYSHYYVPNVKRRFQCFNRWKEFFWLASKKWRRSLRKIIKMSRNNDYTTGNLLDFAYFKGNYRLIAIDLSKQTKLEDPQQINFFGKLENLEQQCFSSLKN